MIYFIDGFDMHIEAPGVSIAGAMDHNTYWYTPPFNNVSYTTGEDGEGQALRLDISANFGLSGGRSSAANFIPSGISEVRAYFFAKFNGSSVSTSWWPIFTYEIGSDTIQLEAQGAGNLRISINGRHPDGNGATSLATGGSISGLWKSFDVYFNYVTGEITVRIDGDVEITTTRTPIAVGAGPDIHFNRHSGWTSIDIDHIVVTDGTDLVDGLNAIAPTIAGDYHSETFGKFRGNLVIDGASYQTLPSGFRANQTLTGGANNANVVYYLYPVHPVTSAAWSAESFAEIEGWGVCSEGVNGTGSIRLTSLGLSVVNVSSGFPRIELIRPGGLAYFSGPWVRENSSVSLTGHINDIPRDPTKADDLVLTIDNLGCILFIEQPDPEDPVFTGVGITFAQEYREDYVDWFKVIPSGLNFESWFITGYMILGEGNKKFQSNYVTVNYEHTNNGGAYLQGVWNYALDPVTGKWGTRQQIYDSQLNFKHKSRKLKVRGHGTTLQMRVSSQDGKDFRINGWTTYATSNTSV